MKVEFYKHNIGSDEKSALLNVLDSIFLTTGDQVEAFEKSLAEYVGAPYAVGLTSCTAALHLALLALGIGPGDEVITTPMTFVATSTAILHAGATPVWVDVEPETGNMNADLIEAAITAKTRAILPVHLYGQMCDMRRIREIADRHHLLVIEDAAHALECRRDGIRVGELADIACFSFYATKSITSGEGGAITTHSEAIADKIKVLRLHGINKDAAGRYTGQYQHWDLLEIGWKYNMDNIQAALLRPQLAKVDLFWEKRKAVFERYCQAIDPLNRVQRPAHLENIRHGYHLFTVWVDPSVRDRVMAMMHQHEVGVAVNYRSIQCLTKFAEIYPHRKSLFPVSRQIGDSTISLPLFPSLTFDEVDYVVWALNDSLKQII